MKNKNLFVLIVSALLFVSISGCSGWETKERQEQREAARERYQKAEAMFQERCKKAGVFIHRTAENVEGIMLLKIRTDSINFRDQYRMDDQYGSDSWGDEYIKSFLLEAKLYVSRFHSPERLEEIRRDNPGYRYVEAIDPKDGKRYRYTGSVKVVGKKDPTAHNVKLAMSRDPNYDLNIYSFVLDKVLAPDPAPRYGVTYDDISTREERDYWIAGSSLKVIDLQTNEVMAERIGYMMDPGQGSNGGGRSPWLSAASYACPAFSPSGARQPGFSYQAEQTRRFATRAVKPTLEK